MLMVFAFSEQGIALGIDSVAWRPDPGIHAQSADSAHGRWITDPADLDASPSRFRAAEAGSVPRSERPASLVLDGQAPGAVRAMGTRGRPPAGTTCGLQRTKNMGIHQVAVGELHLRDAWGGLFEYTNTRSTSFQVGVSYGGRGWQVGGSDSMTATSSLAQAKTIPPAEREDAQVLMYKAELLFKRFDWKCSESGQWEDVSTLQPVSWPNGGMREAPGRARHPGGRLAGRRGQRCAEVWERRKVLRNRCAGRETFQRRRRVNRRARAGDRSSSSAARNLRVPSGGSALPRRRRKYRELFDANHVHLCAPLSDYVDGAAVDPVRRTLRDCPPRELEDKFEDRVLEWPPPAPKEATSR